MKTGKKFQLEQSIIIQKMQDTMKTSSQNPTLLLVLHCLENTYPYACEIPGDSKGSEQFSSSFTLATLKSGYTNCPHAHSLSKLNK